MSLEFPRLDIASAAPPVSVFRCHVPSDPPALAYGPCRRCVAEAQGGSPPSSGICYAFNGAFDGASTCQTCRHSWHDHP